MSLLEINNATMKFGGLNAVTDFSLELEKGELVGLIGPNGAGKTTCFNLVTGIYAPTEGKVFFEGQDISGVRPDKISKLGIGRTFQNIRLYPTLTCLDNVLVGCHSKIKSSPFEAILHTPRYLKEERAFEEKSMALLEAVGLSHIAYENSGSQPYGQQRKLEIARALATEPKLLLLDEPGAGMNVEEIHELMDFILKIRERFELTIFLIEHHMRLVMGICERIKVLSYGHTIAHGTPTEIQNNPEVIKAYLGGHRHA